MKNLHHQEALLEIQSRLQQLTKDSLPKWGKMKIGQMLAHCSKVMDMASGELVFKQMLMGKLISFFSKKSFFDDSPVSRNIGRGFKSPFDITDQRSFEKELGILLDKIALFTKKGAEDCDKNVHVIFGPLSAEEWGQGMYKHLDHHLRQFGV